MNNMYAGQCLRKEKLIIEQLELAAIEKMTVLLVKLPHLTDQPRP